MEKCNCGREGRYYNIDVLKLEGQVSCNKYYVCPTYHEVLEERDKYRKLLKELLVATEGLTIFREGTEAYNESMRAYQRTSKALS
ncbi:conserved hypothetical protein [Vibrio phage 424E50-1]|nr:conserved hypothetical protein [Vibrio phage 424E50-1]